MRKTIAVMTILAFALSACGTVAGVLPSNSSNGPGAGGSPSFSGGNASVPSVPGLQLAAGMIKLDGTPYAVTPQEASKLLPLWQSLAQSESTAATAAATAQAAGTPTPGGTPQARFRFDQGAFQQINTQVVAIENAMTPDQLQTITTMNLNRQDVATILQQAGIQMGTFDQNGGGFRFGNGGTFTPPQGTPPADGTPPASGTPGAFFRNGTGARGGFASFIPPDVVQGIVQWLQKKAAS